MAILLAHMATDRFCQAMSKADMPPWRIYICDIDLQTDAGLRPKCDFLACACADVR